MQTEFDIAVHGLRDRLLRIRSMDSLKMDEEALTLLAEYSRERRFEKGDVLLREGEPLESVYMVLDGMVEVRRKGALVAHVEAGRGVGVLSLLARDPNGVDAVAERATLTLEVPASAFLSTYEENFSATRNALRLATGALLKRRGSLPVDPGRIQEPEMGTYRDRELTLVERIISLRSAPLFGRINLDAVVEICRRMEEVRLPAGHVVWEAGDRAKYNFRIDYGHVRCTNPDGQSVVIGSKWVIGALDVLGDHPRAYTAATETDVIAIKIPGEGFLAVLETNVELAMDMLAMFSSALLQGN